MMEEKSSKKILLSVLGVAILVVAVVGISFAALSFDKTGGTNSITTGTVTMSFAEASNGILLQDALPLSDDLGKGLSGAREYFDFSVTTGANAAVTVYYEINITPQLVVNPATKLDDEQVKVYLEKSTNGTDYTQVLEPTLVSALAPSTKLTGAEVLISEADAYSTATGGNTTTYYRLRMWVSGDVNTADIESSDEYRVYVNVNGYANPITA